MQKKHRKKAAAPLTPADLVLLDDLVSSSADLVPLWYVHLVAPALEQTHSAIVPLSSLSKDPSSQLRRTHDNSDDDGTIIERI